MAFARHDVQVIVKNDEFQHPLVRLFGIIEKPIPQVAVAAFRVRVAGFPLDLLPCHHELRPAQLRHPVFIGMAGDAFVARLIAAVKGNEDEGERKLDEKDNHPAPVPEELPKLVDGHEKQDTIGRRS